jgi:hypothetical protein
MKHLIAVIALLPVLAFATDKRPPAPPPFQNGDVRQGQDQGQTQTQGQDQGQTQGQEQNITVNVGGQDGQPFMQSTDADTTTLTSGDTNVTTGDTSFNSESTNTNVVLVPNNNTEGCLRVFGLSFGNSSGAGGIGYPYRSAACDFEQAADDAAAIGDHNMAWFWRCHKKNVWKPFRRPDTTKEQAIEACHARMIQFLDNGTMQRRINELEEQKATLLELREQDQAVCNERTERCRNELMKALGGKN